MASPLADAPALRAALVRIEKGSVLPTVDDDARNVLKTLGKETGLDFLSTKAAKDLRRLGDLEVLVFPSANREHPLVHVSAKDDRIEVGIDADVLPPSSKVQIRCRQTHAHAMLCDELVDSEPEADGRRFHRFDASPVGPSMAEVEVWVSNEDSSHSRGRSYYLWYAHTVAFIRQVHLQMGLIGQTARFEAGWLDAWSKSRRMTKGRRARLDAMKAIRRVSVHQGTRVGTPDEYWQVAEQAAKELNDKLVPTSSAARYFEPRSDASGDSEFAVAEWFLETFRKDESDGVVVIVDPYFDDWGLDLIARTTVARRQFTVITTLDDKRSEPSDRRLRLQLARKKVRPLLENLLLEIRSVPADRLHDRLILELDANESPVRGFHLSNSLQAAAKKYALLITPIPPDVLGDVTDAIAVMTEDSEMLDDDAIESTVASTVEDPPRPKPTSEDFKKLVSSVNTAVQDNSLEDFEVAWEGYATALANTPSGQHIDERLDTGPKLDSLISALLHRWQPEKLPDRTLVSDMVGLIQASARPFKEQVDLDRIWTHHHSLISNAWSIVFGFRHLRDSNPHAFIEVLDGLLVSGTDSSAAFRGCKLSLALDAVRPFWQSKLSDFEPIVVAMLEATTEFIRALGAAFLGLRVLPSNWGPADKDSLPMEEARSLLERLADPIERVLAISEWIGELRVRANRRDRAEDEDDTKVRNHLNSWLLEYWASASGSPDPIVGVVVSRCEGPSKGSWAAATTNEILIPLVEAGKILSGDVAAVWLPDFAERIESLACGSHFFHGYADRPLTDVCAWILSTQFFELRKTLNEDRATEDLEPITAAFTNLHRTWRAARRTIDRPFVRSLDYHAWSGAHSVLLWLEAVGRMLKAYGTNSKEHTLMMNEWLKNDLELEADDPHPSELSTWVKALRSDNRLNESA